MRVNRCLASIDFDGVDNNRLSIVGVVENSSGKSFCAGVSELWLEPPVTIENVGHFI